MICEHPSSTDAVHALYRLGSKYTDVTDLLNDDFEMLDLIGRTLGQLSARAATSPETDRLALAEHALAMLFDLETDRVLALAERLSRSRQVTEPLGHTRAGRLLYARCQAINALGADATARDYAKLRTGGRDGFSTMSLPHLATLVPPPHLLEMEICLHEHGLFSPKHALRAARWIARGLDVFHAVEKARIDARGSRPG